MATEEDKAAEEPKKRSKKMIIVIAAVVLLAAAGGGGFYYWRVSSVAAAEVAIKKANDKKARSKDTEEPVTPVNDIKPVKKGSDPLENVLPNDEDVKKIVELPPFIVNLVDTEQARYLRMTVSLGVDGEGAASEKPDQLFITRVRNAMLAVLSNKKSEEILSIEGKAKLRKELLSAARAASEDPEVKAIYITDFIVQL